MSSFKDKLHIFLLGGLTMFVICLAVWYFWPEQKQAPVIIEKPVVITKPAVVDTNEIIKAIGPGIYAKAKAEAEKELRKRIKILPEIKEKFEPIKPEFGPAIKILSRQDSIVTSKVEYDIPALNMTTFLWTQQYAPLASAYEYELNMKEIQHMYPVSLKFANIAAGALLAGIIYVGVRNW